MTEIIDKVKGNWIINCVPTFSFELTETVPPNDSIVLLTTSSPTPRPDISETFSAVEKPLDRIKL